MRAAIIVCLLGASPPGFACTYPDEGGMPLRRAVTRVETRPEVDAWARFMQQSGIKPQYVVKLDAPVREGKRCYWPVEVRVEGRLWRRYLVTPDGKNVLVKE